MNQLKKLKTSLQIEDEIDRHVTGWIIQRIGWGLLAIIFIAAALGLFGTGYLSYQRITEGENSIEFERFGRFETPNKIMIHATPKNGIIEITIPQAYLTQYFELEKIIPEPTEQKIERTSFVYVYKVDHPATIILEGQPGTSGRSTAAITVNNSTFTIGQFIYP